MWLQLIGSIFGQAVQTQPVPTYSYAQQPDYTPLYALAGLGAIGVVAYLVLRD